MSGSDRLPRRPILIAGDVGRALVLGAVAAAAVSGRLAMAHLYAAGFLTGVFTVFFDVAYQAYLPSLVDRRQLVEGNSRLEVSRSAAQISGPGLAGVIIQALSAPVAILLDAVSFLFSGAAIGLIRRREAPPARTERAPMIREVREGLGVVFGSRELRAIAGCTGTGNFFSSVWGALIILFATRELGLSAAAIGLIYGIGNAGALLGALMAGRVAARFGVGPTIIGAALVAAVSGFAVPLATRANAVPLLVAGGVVAGLANVIYNVNQVSLRQAITPERLQGRMNATMRFVVWGTIPLGSLAGGVLGEALGLRRAIMVGVLGGLLDFLWVVFSPVRTLQRIPDITGEVAAGGGNGTTV